MRQSVMSDSRQSVVSTRSSYARGAYPRISFMPKRTGTGALHHIVCLACMLPLPR